MRPVFLYTLLLISHHAFNQSREVHEKDSLVKVLDTIDLEQFQKKRTDHFLKHIPSNYKVEISTSTNFNYPYTAILKFPDRPYVEIRLLYERLAYTNPNSMFSRKIAKRLKKEIIQKVEIYDEYQCVNGCGD